MTQLTMLGFEAEEQLQDVLAVIPELQQRRGLHLGFLTGAAAPADFAALTSSSHLKYASLERCNMAAAAPRHMFRTGRLLPGLLMLQIGIDMD
uniref:Uncharacterized protein n=1 Tax=Tetradesmus obliquus TaxID=3088 RepID=A0A383VGH8_TETOB|eukprot:jgi/Sobl393_1/16235/SZX64043.1